MRVFPFTSPSQRHSSRRYGAAAALLALLLAAAPSGFARTPHHGGHGNDRVSFGQDITVDAEETVGDIACAFCTVRLHGDAQGDVAILFGRVELDSDHTIAGDVAMLGGDATLRDNSTVAGDVAIVAGDLELSPGAVIRGDRFVLPGRAWLLLPFAPLLVLVGIIWLIVWLVRRSRYPVMPYAPPPPPLMR